MAVRKAQHADAADIQRHIKDFMGVRLLLPKIRKRMDDPNIVTYISAAGYCEFKLNQQLQVAQCTSLLPRGIPIAQLKPLLQGGLDEIRRRHPASWRIWASFWGAVDENGVRDGGESECRAWQRNWPGSTVSEQDGTWVVEALLGAVT